MDLLDKLASIKRRYEEIELRLGDPKIIGDMRLFKQMNKEYKDLKQLVDAYHEYKSIILNIDTLTDELTNVISNDEFKLCNSKTYEREIHTRIQNSDKYVLNQIFNYRG
jgi:peptide chain release factor 1